MHFEYGRFVLFAIADEITVDELKTVVDFEFDVSPKLVKMMK